MTQDKRLLDAFHSLPPEKQAAVFNFIGYLKAKTMQAAPKKESRNSYGSLKETFKMSAYFDEPLDDFKDYM